MSDIVVIRKRGRPRLPDSHRRAVTVSVRVTEVELKQLTSVAERRNITLSDLLRLALYPVFRDTV